MFTAPAIELRIMSLSALVLCYLASGFIVQAQPIQYDLAHVTTGACSGPSPTVEFSLRSSINRDDDIPQEFTEWTLIQYYTGNCSQDQTLITNLPNPGTHYQFRVEITPATSCHCVTLTSIMQPFGSVLTSWNNGEFWCGINQPLLCASRNKVSRFLSRVVTVTDNSNTLIAACDGNQLSSYNTTDLAVAYEGVFGTCPEAQQCFPLSPLQQNNANVEINFSLILDLNIGPTCRSLCNANEGILLRADSSISTAYLNFYYNKPNRGNEGGTRIPQLTFIDGGRVLLSYDQHVTDIKVPGTFNAATGLQMYNVSSSLIVNRVVRMKWEQHTVTPARRGDCDTVSLDSTAVSLNWNQCVRNVLNEDFNNQQTLDDWELLQVSVSNNSMFCLDSYPCLYYVGVNRTTDTSALMNVRFSSSPLLDLRVVKAVKPPPATIPTIMNSTKCTKRQKWLMMTFQLVMTQFQYPTPCNEQDNTPKGVVMTISRNTPLAYFAPLAHDSWNQFTRDSMSYNIDGVDVPILSPVHNQLTKVSLCISDNDELLEVAWRQDNFTSNQNYWYLHIERLILGDIDIQNITLAGGDNYNLSITNGANSSLTNCDISGAFSFFGLTGSNSQSPRAVTMTVTLSSSLLPATSALYSTSDTTVSILPTSTVVAAESSFTTISPTPTVAGVINSSDTVLASGNTSLSASSTTGIYSSTTLFSASTMQSINPVITSTSEEIYFESSSTIVTIYESSFSSTNSYTTAYFTPQKTNDSEMAGTTDMNLMLVLIILGAFVVVGILLIVFVSVAIVVMKYFKSPVQQKDVPLEKIAK